MGATQESQIATKIELTDGQKAVRLDCDPSASLDVVSIKNTYANIIDLLIEKRKSAKNAEVARDLSIAVTDAENSCMRAVRAITYPY